MVSGGGCELAAVTHRKINLGTVPPTASPSREPQPVTFDPGVFDLCEKCHVSRCRDVDHDYGYSEPSPVLWQGNDLFDLDSLL